MTTKHSLNGSALQKLRARISAHRRASHGGHGPRRWRLRQWLKLLFRRPILRRIAYGVVIACGIFAIALGGLWWRLASGPIEFDLATPWLTAAIEQNFGGRYSVEVGGTQLERGQDGRTALRIRDILVRAADGTVVASAPKAEIGLSGSSLLAGRVRAESLNLVGAEMSVRVETDGKITVFAGADTRPIATASARPSAEASASPSRSAFEDIAALLAWIDGLGASGLDGYELGELGLKNGNLIVDDQRDGKRWAFTNINLSIKRLRPGGVIFRVNSENPERPWQLSAAVTPKPGGVRAVVIEAQKVSTKELLLALRFGDMVNADLPLSAIVEAEITADGAPLSVKAQLLAEAGHIRQRGSEATGVNFDRAEFVLDWDARRGTLVVPHIFLVSGSNRATLRAQLEMPSDQAGVWSFALAGGTIVLATPGLPDEDPLVLNRINVRARIDTVRRRIDLEQSDFGSINIGVAISGNLDYSGAEPRLAFGVAGTKMPVTAMKRLWPIFVAANVRRWVEEHISGGVVERLVIAANAPLSVFRDDELPIPDDALSVEIETSGTTIRPINSLPAIRDADLNVRVSGRTAMVGVGRGTVEVSPGRKLNIAGGVFEVPDVHPHDPPARVRFRMDGSVPAAAELLASEALRGAAGTPFDPATSRGTVTAQIALNLPLSEQLSAITPTYNITADITNFAADRMLLGQKVEAASLRVTASSQGYQVKGDAKIGGTPAALEYRQSTGDAQADLRLQATLDEAARGRLGVDFGASVTGSVPVKVAGRIGAAEKDNRLVVEADFTPAKLDNLLPGWVKPAGRAAHATFTAIRDKSTTRLDDLSIDGQGVLAKGSIEIDASGELVAVNFPVLAMSDGDKLTLKADRGADGTLRVVVRGDVFDGRNFIKSSMGGPAAEPRTKRRPSDLDLDVKLSAVAGHNGEALRALDLRLSRRAGRLRSFNMNAKIGRDAPLIGDMRLRVNSNRQVLFFETNDAGALFRFADVYPRMTGGKMWVAMDPPNADLTPQEGLISISNFAVRGESGLDPVLANAPNAGNRGTVEFTQLRADFTRTAGRMLVRDGVVRGPAVGATIDGQIDYGRDEVQLRGTFIPLYGLNNVFGQIPIVGIFLGGNEGLVGISYEVTGPPGNTRLKVNPMTAIAPGVLRKFFEALDPNRMIVEPPR